MRMLRNALRLISRPRLACDYLEFLWAKYSTPRDVVRAMPCKLERVCRLRSIKPFNTSNPIRWSLPHPPALLGGFRYEFGSPRMDERVGTDLLIARIALNKTLPDPALDIVMWPTGWRVFAIRPSGGATGTGRALLSEGRIGTLRSEWLLQFHSCASLLRITSDGF